MNAQLKHVLDPARLAALRKLGLLDTPSEAVFDNLGDLAAKLLAAPIALVTLVDVDRQFFKSCRGLPEPWASWRQTPLSHSFCKHVVDKGEPLIISDSRKDERVRDNQAVSDLGVIAYLGIPLLLSGGHVLGSFCVIDSKPRNWTPEQINTLQLLTQCVVTELELRSEIQSKQAAMVQLQTAYEELEAFSYSVSHDLKSPLRAITAFSELLQDEFGGALPPQAREYLVVITRGGRRMATLIDGLLALARVGKSSLCVSDVDLSQVAADIVADLRAMDPGRSVDVQITPSMAAKADPRLLRQALENLLRNAWKFTSPQPHAIIEVSSRPAKAEQLFFVKDNGVGFNGHQTEQLFKPFRRLHGNEFPGNGIGLATVKRIIERHHGRVCAEPNPGGGAVFYFTLPNLPVE